MYPHDKRYPDYIADQIKKGTTTCGLICKDGVVLAADTAEVQASLSPTGM